MFGKCFILMALMATLSFSEVEEHWRYEKIRSAYLAVAMQESEEQFYDHRLVTLKSGNLVDFRHDNITKFVQLELDEDNNQLLIGSSDYIYRLRLDNLAALEIEKWVAPDEAVSSCHIDQRVKYCSNFIVILKTVQDKVLTCGTLASAPMCLYRNITNLATVISNITRGAVCPMSPSYLSTAVFTSDQVLYSATFTDRIGLNPMISRISPDPDVKLLLGKARDSYWFNAPSFIASFELDDYVYIFLLETSVECANCGERIVSRVARVCKKDPGANILKPFRLFASFSKARLNCSLPADVPFYFDQIQSVYLEREEKTFYAIFTAPPMPGSAVCAYNMSAIEKTFGGSFKYRKSLDCDWEKMTSSYSKLCGSPEPTGKQINDVSDLIFMNDEVQPTLVGPMIVYDYDMWNNIEVDRVVTMDSAVTVIYVSSSKGYIKKLTVLPHGNTACLIEHIRLTEEGMPETLLKMKLSKAKSALYVAMETRIIKLPLTRCRRHRTKAACIGAQDPYCGWDMDKILCISLSEAKEDNWEQDITKCPLLDLPVDGGWSGWNDWSICPYILKDFLIQKCYCRNRVCNQPRRAFNGEDCVGHRTEITNCSFDEGWAEWGEWTGCPLSCEFARRQRSRQCKTASTQTSSNPCSENVLVEQIGCPDVCHGKSPLGGSTRVLTYYKVLTPLALWVSYRNLQFI